MSINPRGVGFTGDDVIMLFGEYFEYLLCDHPVAGCRRELSGIACPAQPFLEWNHGVEACELVVDEILLSASRSATVLPLICVSRTLLGRLIARAVSLIRSRSMDPGVDTSTTSVEASTAAPIRSDCDGGVSMITHVDSSSGG